MRRPRTIVTGAVAITLVCAFAVAATALAFTDVPDSHPHAGAVNELAGLGVVNGKGDGTFRPDDLVRRAQFAKMMCGLLGLTVSENESFAPFLDLGPDDPGDLYPHEFVGAAYRLGVIKGKTATAFAPYADITLAQVVTMVVRAADARYPALLATPPAGWQGPWDDTDPTHGANIRRADYAGLLANLPVGSPETEPSRPATRGEVSQILFDLLQKIDSGSAPDVQKELEFTHLTIDSSGPNDIWLKTVGDLNGDGRPDLVAGGHDSGGLVWYQNPSWTKKVIAATGRFSTDGEVGDVDKDGDNDVVVLTSSGLLWYENPSWQSHPISDEPLHDLELADLDGDGDLDLAARDQGEFGHSGKVLHLFRQDTSTSWTHRTVSIADGEGLLLADLDRDGDRDVVVNGSWYENTRDILNGPWTKHTYTASWTHPNVYVAAGDVNGDGRVDLVLAPSELAGNTYRLSWFAAPADPRSGGWQEHFVDNPVETVVHFVGLADFDNDGDLDIAAAEMQQGADPDEVTIFANVDGDGLTWNPKVLAGTGSHSMRIVDVDADGDMDLYGANWKDNQVELWLNETP